LDGAAKQVNQPLEVLEMETSPAPADSSFIAVERASVGFAGRMVLREIDLQVRRGETLVIVGESGCGKTVLLKLIIGLLRPWSGRILFDGRCIGDLKGRELTRQRLRFGFLFQGAALFDCLSVFDNVAFGLREQRRLGEAEVAEQIRRRLQEVGLPPGVAAQMPAELSGGMKKRVGLARALALDPEVMLYDEPTTGLDPIMSDVINELNLQTRHRRPVTSVVITHDMKTARKVADRVVMLYPLAQLRPGENQILYAGSPDELDRCQDPRVRQFVEGEARERLGELAAS
jgi:phospholipid/cholesterol/gamma-HCH transport system ATP-binding protein